MKKKSYGLVLTFSLLIAFSLSVLPLPAVLSWFRPQWILLLVIWWNVVAPHRFSMGMSCSAGFVLDILSGVPLGVHAIPYVCISYFIGRFYQRIRVFPFLQQLLVIMGFIVLHQLFFFMLSSEAKTLSYAGLLFFSFITTFFIAPFVLRIMKFYYDSEMYSG